MAGHLLSALLLMSKVFCLRLMETGQRCLSSKGKSLQIAGSETFRTHQGAVLSSDPAQASSQIGINHDSR